MRNRFLFINVLSLLISIILDFLKIALPDSANMAEFQFNMFTISSVLAGFSFTILSILLGISSEKIMHKLNNTTIITEKSEKIVMSLLEFCLSGLISLLFIVGIMDLPYIMRIRRLIFFCGEVFLFIGLLYFVKSVYEIYKLIITIYGVNSKEVENKRREFKNALNKAKERNNVHEDKEESWKEDNL